MAEETTPEDAAIADLEKKTKKKRIGKSELMMQILNDGLTDKTFEMFPDQFGKPFVAIDRGSHKELLPLNVSGDFNSELSHRYFQQRGQVASASVASSVLNTALAPVRAMERRHLHNRVGGDGSSWCPGLWSQGELPSHASCRGS